MDTGDSNETKPVQNIERKSSLRKLMVRSVVVLGLIVFYSIASGNLPIWRLYMAAPIRGVVLDAETNKPLSGVVVVANWNLKRDKFFHGMTHLGPLWLVETVTNEKGEYYIPGQRLSLAPAAAYFGTSDPDIYFFKSEFRPLIVENQLLESRLSWSDKEIFRVSRWDTKEIKLERFSIYRDQMRNRTVNPAYYRALKYFSITIKEGVRYLEKCDWEKIPRIIVAVDKEMIRLEKLGYLDRGVINPSSQTIRTSLQLNQGSCREPRAVLGY